MRITLVNCITFLGLSHGFNILAKDAKTSRTKRWVDIENITFSFDCADKAIGFYADVEFDCQIFHMCDEQKRRIPHLCANDTSFNQEYRICDWEYNFNCSEAPKWYYLNELTYATEPPIDDYEFEREIRQLD